MRCSAIARRKYHASQALPPTHVTGAPMYKPLLASSLQVDTELVSHSGLWGGACSQIPNTSPSRAWSGICETKTH